MAIFNPTGPEVQPREYHGLFQPIDRPLPDERAATAIKGIGQSLDIAVKASDFEHKEYLQDQIYPEVNAKREAYTQMVEAAKAKFTGGQVTRTDVNGNPIGTPSEVSATDILGAHAEALPDDLEGLPASLEALGAAKASGKYSQTFLAAQYDSMAKDYRARFPGNRDYIDSLFQKYTGEDPANARLKGALSDLNSWVAQSAAAKNKTLNLAYQNMHISENMPAWIMAYKSGQMSEYDMLQKIYQGNKNEYDLKSMRTRLDQRKVGDEGAAIEASDYLGKVATQSFTDDLDTFVTPTGIKANLATAVQAIQDNPQSDSAIQFAAQIEQHKQRAMDKVRAEARIPGPDGKTPEDKMGTKAFNELLAAKSKNYDDYKDLITNDKYGAAFITATQAKGLSEDTLITMARDKEIGPFIKMYMAAAKMGGPEAAKALIEKMMATDVPEKLKAYFNNQLLKLSTASPLENSETATLKGVFKEGYTKGIESGSYYNKFIDSVESIGNRKVSDAQAKIYADSIFSPEGQSFLSIIKEGGSDKPGRMGVFARLTKQDITDRMQALDKVYPGMWDRYKSWTTSTFSREIMGKELNELSNIQDYKGFKFGWNTDSHEIIFQPTSNKGRSSLDRYEAETRYFNVKPSIDRINVGLRAINRIGNADGTNVDAYTLGVLKNYIDQGRMEGIPTAIAQEIINANKTEQKRKEEQRKTYTP